MAKIYKVGPDEAFDIREAENDTRFEWVVYWYKAGDYEGDGEAVGFRRDVSLLYTKNLSHCSCYGPFNGWATDLITTTVREFFREKDNIHDMDSRPEIKRKVSQLLGVSH